MIIFSNGANDFGETNTPAPPPILYHYTSIEKLISIIDSGSIWASHIRYLNDSSEAESLWKVVLRRLEARRDSAISSEERTSFSELIESVNKRPMPNEFVASFSEKADDLSQWRAYCPGGAGVSIGFLSAALRGNYPLFVYQVSVAGKEVPPWDRQARAELFKVRYLDEENTSDLEALVDVEFERAKELAGRKMPEGWPGPPITLGNCFLSLFLLVAAAFKHKSFCDEFEWRLVLSSAGRPMPGQRFRAGKSNPIPYVEVELNRNGDSSLVDDYMVREVVVGPTPNPDLSVEALQNLFATKGYDKVIVRKSTIPYRHW